MYGYLHGTLGLGMARRSKSQAGSTLGTVIMICIADNTIVEAECAWRHTILGV